MDSDVFVDLFAKSLSPSPLTGASWSSADLRGAFVRATFDFFYSLVGNLANLEN